MTLKEARKKVLKMTQEEIASKIGVSVRTWIRYENKRCPSPILQLVQMMVNEKVQPARQI